MGPVKNTKTLLLNRLHCYFVEEHEYDEVLLKYNGKKIWPKNKKWQAIMMDTTTALEVEIDGIEENQDVVIEVWDWDLLSPNDKLGTFTLPIENDVGAFSSDMVKNLTETNKAKYSLDWELV